MFSTGVGKKNSPLAPRGELGCQLRGWLIRPDNDACLCPQPRTRIAATFNGGRLRGQKDWEQRRWRLKRAKPQKTEVVEEMEVERRNKMSAGKRRRIPNDESMKECRSLWMWLFTVRAN